MATAVSPTVFVSGKNAQLYMGTVTGGFSNLANVNLVRAEIRGTRQVVRFQNSQTGQFTGKVTTFIDCSATLHTDWNPAANPFAATATAGLSLTSGQEINCEIFPTGTSGAYWSFPAAVIEGNPQTIEVSGKIMTQIHISSDGVYYEPQT